MVKWSLVFWRLSHSFCLEILWIPNSVRDSIHLLQTDRNIQQAACTHLCSNTTKVGAQETLNAVPPAKQRCVKLLSPCHALRETAADVGWSLRVGPESSRELHLRGSDTSSGQAESPRGVCMRNSTVSPPLLKSPSPLAVWTLCYQTHQWSIFIDGNKESLKSLNTLPC